MISEKRRDYYAGGVVFLIGVGAAVIGARYQVGTLTKMGPGFFPTALGVILALMGIMIAAANLMMAKSDEPPKIDLHHGIQSSPDWRGWGCIVGSVLTFIALAELAGLVAATFMCVFVACWGDRGATLKGSAILAAGITVFGVVLFSYVLRVQIPIVRGF